MFYAQQNQLQDAAGFLQKAIELPTGLPRSLEQFGCSLCPRAGLCESRGAIHSCIRVHPASISRISNLARLYVMQNDKTKAKEILQELPSLQPKTECQTSHGCTELIALSGPRKFRRIPASDLYNRNHSL